jgi:S1-C subfamily serine protease
MARSADWSFPAELQPSTHKLGFDLDDALDALVQVRAEVPEDAFTAGILGTERTGNGVVIREKGLVLTIGYLVTEASSIWLTTNRGAAVPGYPLAYDQASGFGLVQALGPLDASVLERGSAKRCRVGDEIVVAGHGGRAHALMATVFAKREFAGYWEYLLEEALFTSPAHPQWGGSAAIDLDGRLVGIGSLFVQEKQDDESIEGNMIVPVDLLEPILDDLVKLGRSSRPARPWLGMYTTEVADHLVIAGLADGGPAEQAGLEVGDLLLEVAGERPKSLAHLFRSVWRLGPPGVEVPVTYARSGTISRAVLRSADRSDFLKKPHLH